MKQKTKEIIALLIIIIQLIFGAFLILFGIFGANNNLFIITLGVFLLIGAGRKEVWDIFKLFKTSQ